MTTKLIEVRGPTAEEAAALGGDVVFVRRDRAGVETKIHASVSHESWSQWGADRDLLGENQEAVESWRRGLDDVLGLIDESDFADEPEEAESGDWEVGDRAYVGAEGDRGEIIEIITTGLPDSARGRARVKMQLDYWRVGELWEGSIDDIDTLDDE
ncbi:hypothetical protein BAJUN_01810 [Bajunvirus bajun]|uniref:Uncharacterized protein n=1 Tax=Brevundimonas phage vB_BgoS-Bajun TaxID=2948594 RepID=A0A9E7STB8_9CAUD|nr:hypothetical protein BAJUN_01810 [Brevundimonas phage vB_BgoS-Bajun]